MIKETLLNLWPFKLLCDRGSLYDEIMDFVDNVKPPRESRNIEGTIIMGEELEEMCRTEGWDITERWIGGKMAAGLKKIVDDCSLEEVALERARLKAYKDLRDYIKGVIARSKTFKDDLSKKKLGGY